MAHWHQGCSLRWQEPAANLQTPDTEAPDANVPDRRQPLLLVLEDLQWIDSETHALLDGLVESLPTSRLCLLIDYRPEHQHAWGNKAAYSQLRLDSLPPENAHVLLDSLLGHDPELHRLKALLIERTEGNPFFLEETVQTLAETDALVGERGAHRLARADRPAPS